MSYTKITNFAIKDSTNDIIKGTEFDDEFNSIEASFTAQPSATQTLTNKTIALGSNTVSGTTAQFNTALTDGDFATLAGSETLTNKALNGSLGATTPSSVVATTGNYSQWVRSNYGQSYSLIMDSDGSYAYVATGGAPFQVRNGTTQQMTIDSSGNVGIGVSPSGWTSSAKAIEFQKGVALASYSASPIMTLSTNTYDNGVNNIYKTSNYVTLYQQDSGAHRWYTAASGVAGNNVTFVLGMQMDASRIVTMSAYGAGAATFSAAGVISSVSDETWKTKDGVPLNSDAMLKKLEPGYWYYNEEKAPIFGADRQLGFYAQNVNYAIGVEAAPIPEEGKPWGYYDRSVLAVTVMSLQKALTTIESLTARLEVLEAK